MRGTNVQNAGVTNVVNTQGSPREHPGSRGGLEGVQRGIPVHLCTNIPVYLYTCAPVTCKFLEQCADCTDGDCTADCDCTTDCDWDGANGPQRDQEVHKAMLGWCKWPTWLTASRSGWRKWPTWLTGSRSSWSNALTVLTATVLLNVLTVTVTDCECTECDCTADSGWRKWPTRLTGSRSSWSNALTVLTATVLLNVLTVSVTVTVLSVTVLLTAAGANGPRWDQEVHGGLLRQERPPSAQGGGHDAPPGHQGVQQEGRENRQVNLGGL
eukprot:208288-Prorocentrum_minimum.AAC.1